MTYHLDLSQIPLMEYREILKTKNLLPGRRIVLMNIDENFTRIKEQGIENMEQLKKALSTPVKLSAFAALSGVPKDYLNLLRRESGSLVQKPVPLSDFPDMDQDKIMELKKEGINHSKDYWEKKKEPGELFGLCDLVRINGVGAAAAKTFYEAGYTALADLARADAKDMLSKVSAVNSQKQYYKASLGVSDMQFVIDHANLIKRYEP